MESVGERVVVLIDMDCFFCQVETRLQPKHKGKPLAVAQYTGWQLGGIIAVNYEAREFGVTRHMRSEEAKQKCPDLIICSVPALRGKSDTSRYRNAGREVIQVLKKHCNIIERASVDEAYLDITSLVDERLSKMSTDPEELIGLLPNTYVVGFSTVGSNDEEERKNGLSKWTKKLLQTTECEDPQAVKLAVGGIIVEELRADVYQTTGFRCSAGISYNKILAKLACGLHKPNRQTILPKAAVPSLYLTLPVKKVRNLGGKFGDIIVESLNCNVMADLARYSLKELQKRFDEKDGLWLYNIARGIDNEPVTSRLISKSIGACKKFPGKQAIKTLDVLKQWFGELAAEVCERLEQDLEENERRATLLTVSFHYYRDRKIISQSRSCPLNSYKPERMAKQCVDVVTKSTQCPIAFLGISVSKFIPAKGSGNFVNFFKAEAKKNSDESSPARKGETEKEESHKILQQDLLKIGNKKNTILAEFSPARKEETEKEESHKILEKDLLENDDKKNPVGNIINYNKEEKISVEKSGKLRTDFTPDNKKLLEFIETEKLEEIDERNRGATRDVEKETKKEEHFSRKRQIIEVENLEEISPTSRRLERLMEFCNVEKNGNANSSGNCRKKPKILFASSPSNQMEEDYKESYFLNALKDKDSKISEKVENRNVRAQSETPPKNTKNSFFLNALSKTEMDTEEEKTNHSTAEIETPSNRKSSESETNSSVKNDSHEIEVKLEDIFPDLNNIDPSVVYLLPPKLQEEAFKYLGSARKSAEESRNAKNSGTKNSKSSKNSKSEKTKSKNSNSKDSKKINSIAGFLIKSKSEDDSVSFKKCMKCDQLIPAARYFEHNDFHVAQSLQSAINRSPEERWKTVAERDDLIQNPSVFS